MDIDYFDYRYKRQQHCFEIFPFDAEKLLENLDAFLHQTLFLFKSHFFRLGLDIFFIFFLCINIDNSNIALWLLLCIIRHVPNS